MPDIPEGLPRKNNHVQSIIIDKNMYSLKEANKLILDLGYYIYDIRETKNFYRYRQFNPSEYGSTFTVKSAHYPGVNFIVEIDYNKMKNISP